MVLPRTCIDGFRVYPKILQIFPLFTGKGYGCSIGLVRRRITLGISILFKIRKSAIQHLVHMALAVPGYAYRVADVLLQLLQSYSKEELEIVTPSISISLKAFPQGFLV